MNEVNEILGTRNQSSNYTTKSRYKNRNYNNRNQKSNYHNNSWIEQQNRDRQQIWATMDRMALTVSRDSNKFQEYLKVQCKFEKYSVGNCLVLLEKMPNATRIKDKESWNEKGIELKPKAKSVKILEPSISNDVTYYNPKEIYDISQTNAPKQQSIKYDDRSLLEAICYDCQVPKKPVDKLPNGEYGAEYNREENVLYVCKGIERELLFQSLFQAIANIEMQSDENSSIKTFRSYCISYMMCQKYGVDTSNYEFKELPKEITNQHDSKRIRSELEQIRVKFEQISTRIAEYFEISNKEKNKSTPER